MSDDTVPADVLAAFERLVTSVTIGGDEPERFAEIRITDKRERVVFPRETLAETGAVVRHLLQDAVVSTQRSEKALFNDVRIPAQSSLRRSGGVVYVTQWPGYRAPRDTPCPVDKAGYDLGGGDWASESGTPSAF